MSFPSLTANFPIDGNRDFPIQGMKFGSIINEMKPESIG